MDVPASTLMVEWAQERNQWEQERKQWEQERQQWTHDGSVGSRAQAVDSRTHVFSIHVYYVYLEAGMDWMDG